MELSNIDLFYFLKELKIIENSRIENFYLCDDKFFIKFHSKQTDKTFFVKNKNIIYLDNKKEDTKIPNPFIMALRKLKNGIIQSVEQMLNERILKITITKKNDKGDILTYHLYIELFLFSNVILCSDNDIIINILSKKFLKNRILKLREKYILPKNSDFGFMNFSKEKFLENYKKSKDNIEKFLAGEFSFTKKYSNEILLRCNMSNDLKFVDLKNNDLEKLEKEILKIKNEVLNPNISGSTFYPFIFFKKNENIQNFKTINDCFKFLAGKNLEDNSNKNQYNLEITKLLKRIEAQEKQKKNIETEILNLNEIGNKIYENYDFLNTLLGKINTLSKTKGWEFVKAEILKNKELQKKIVKLDEKNNIIEIDV